MGKSIAEQNLEVAIFKAWLNALNDNDLKKVKEINEEYKKLTGKTL